MLRTIFGSIFTHIQTVTLTLILGALLPLPSNAAMTELKCSALFERNRIQELKNGEKAFGQNAASYSLDGNTRNDLNVQGMLYPQLNKMMTVWGQRRLSHLLENPFLSETEIVARQDAIKALARDPELRARLRQQLTRLEVLNEDVIATLEAREKPISGRVIALVNALMTGGLAAMVAPDVMKGHYNGIFQALMPLTFINAQTVKLHQQARDFVLPYKALAETANDVRADLDHFLLRNSDLSPLVEISDMLAAVIDKDHPQSIAQSSARRLRRVSRSRLMTVLDFLYGHSSWTLRGTQRSIINDRQKLAGVLSALAELDVFLALAEVAAENHDSMVFPKIVNAAHAYLQIEDGHHPYLHANRRGTSVANSAILMGVDPAHAENEGRVIPNFAILTGANAGGKSTYLKMIALNAIQGQIGAPVPAKAFVFTPVETLTNIDISDSVETGKSFFRAEAKRLGHIVDRMKEQPKILVVMDEILLGTNPKDRQAVEEEVIRWMAESGRMALLATHDIEMTRIANDVPGIQNLQVEEVQEADGSFRFSFRIRPGISQTSTAYEVLRAEGVPADLVERAMKRRLEKN